MPAERLLRYTLLFEAVIGRRTVRGDQSMKCAKSMKNLSSGLARVCGVRLPGWDPRDSPNVMVRGNG